MSEEELKLCPFCGHQPTPDAFRVGTGGTDEDAGSAYVLCVNCGARGPDLGGDGPVDHVEHDAWFGWSCRGVEFDRAVDVPFSNPESLWHCPKVRS